MPSRQPSPACRSPFSEDSDRRWRFFTAAHHPARQLLDRMALRRPRPAAPGRPGSAGLRPPEEIAARCARVRRRRPSLRHRRRRSRSGDRRASGRNRPAWPAPTYPWCRPRPAPPGNRQARAALAPLIADDTPTAIADFLESIWYRHLRALWLEGGEGGPAWARPWIWPATWCGASRPSSRRTTGCA